VTKYILIAVAALTFASHLCAQGSIDAPIAAEPPALAERAAPPVSTPAVPTNQTIRSSKGFAPLQELSPWSMFVSSDPLVQGVMISLVFASIVSWTIFLAKTIKLRFARWRLHKWLVRLSGAAGLSEAQLALGSARNVLATLIAAAVQEIRLSPGSGIENSIKERAGSRFSEIVHMERRAARQGMVILATIGSTAPFVGLFGTVWGIMNSFIGISKFQTTNLAVVAPDIAEALLATAFGLAAAIPAVIFYNQLTRTTRLYLDLVGRALGCASRLLSRDLDRGHGRVETRAAE
jgi:biopolymer transport protein ExbB